MLGDSRLSAIENSTHARVKPDIATTGYLRNHVDSLSGSLNRKKQRIWTPRPQAAIALASRLKIDVRDGPACLAALHALTHRILGGLPGVILPADGLSLATLARLLHSRNPTGRIRRLHARTERRNLLTSVPTPTKFAAGARLPRGEWPGDPRNPG